MLELKNAINKTWKELTQEKLKSLKREIQYFKFNSKFPQRQITHKDSLNFQQNS